MSSHHTGPPEQSPELAPENLTERPAEQPKRGRRRWSTRRRIVVGLGVFALLALAGAAWVLYTGLKARTELEAVRAAVHNLRDDVSAGDLSAARADAELVRMHSDRAYDLTTGPVWAVAAAIPYLGDPLDTTRAVTSSVHAVADGALPAVVQATHGLSGKTLRGPDGRLDVAAISALAGPLDHAASVMDGAVHTISAASDTTWLGSVNTARDDLLDQLTRLNTSVHGASLAADVTPAMLGANGPRTYMVTFENNAELRGLGGLPGAFAILRADHGKLSFVHFGSNDSLYRTASGVDLGTDFTSLWPGQPTKSYKNSDGSPHFPYAAQIWASMWQRKSGQHLDGAIALDPTALSYLLAVTGPATLPDHTKVSTDNVVALTQQEVYARWPLATDKPARKKFLDDVARAVAKKFVTTTASPTALLKAAGKAAAEYRLLLWARDPAIENRLAPLPLAGEVPTTSPYAGLAIVNTLGSKLDYYLHGSFSYQRTGCGTTRSVTATITLSNEAPAHLPKYVYGYTGFPGYPKKRGATRLAVYYYASSGAQVTSVTNDGEPFTSSTGAERGHPVVKMNVTIPAGQERTLVVHLTEPAGTGAPVVRLQPMINPLPAPRIVDADCGS
jgi:hypothetical protein